MLFKDWFNEYYEVYCNGVLAYDYCYDCLCINKKHFSCIADMELSSIRPIDVQRVVKSTMGYSSDRQRRTYFLLKRVLREAVVNDLIEKNPAEYIKPPKRIRKDVSCFKIEHLEQLFDDDSKYSRMFQFDLWTGLRRGELLALTWTNIHVPEKYLNVCQTLVRTAEGDIIVPTTKSRCDRVVPLHDRAILLLEQIKTLDSSDGFLFRNADGSPLKLRQYNRIYCKYCAQQLEKYPDLPYYTPHNLRHSYATYMLQSGADIETLRALLGHVDITTTQRYVHSNLNQMYKATDNLKFGNL